MTTSAACRRLGGESGQTLIMVAILLPVMMGVSGLALDVGTLYHHRRRMQTAADAGALAGAYDVYRGRPGSAVATATRESGTNGFTNGTDGSTVTVHYPPVAGNHVGDTRFVEVIVDQAAPTWFMSLFGWNSVDVKARAVAGAGSNGANCVYVLDPSMDGAFQGNSSAVLDASCGIIVNSTDSDAMRTSSSAQVIATNVSITGGYAIASSSSITPTPVVGVPPEPDPLAYLQPPPSDGCDVTNFHVTTGTHTLSPGVYCRGMTIVNNGHVILQPGMYVLKGGGLDMQSNAILEGTGVTFFITEAPGFAYGTISLQSSTQIRVTAPTSGPYAGILFYQDPNAGTPNKSHHFESSTNALLEGALYFPTQQVKIHSSSNLDARYTIVVARALSMESSANFKVRSDYGGLSGGSPIKRISLVE
jgi:hypothetical protein